MPLISLYIDYENSQDYIGKTFTEDTVTTLIYSLTKIIRLILK